MTRDKALEVGKILCEIEEIEAEISLIKSLVCHEELEEKRAFVMTSYLQIQLEINEEKLRKL